MTRLDTLLLTMLFLGCIALADEKFFDLLPEWLRLVFYFLGGIALFISLALQDRQKNKLRYDLKEENKRLKTELTELKQLKHTNRGAVKKSSN